MRFKLPHSPVGYDLVEAQEILDNLIAFQRFLEAGSMDSLDLAIPYYRFTMNFAWSPCGAIPLGAGTGKLALPFACAIENAHFWTGWGAGPHGGVNAVVYPNYLVGDSAVISATMDSVTPVVDRPGLTAVQQANKELYVVFGNDTVPPVSLLAFGVTLNCKALVEVL